MSHPLAARRHSPARRSPGLVFISLLLLLGGAGLLVVLLVAGAAAVYYPQLPALDKVTAYQPRQPLQVYTREGVEIAQFGAERRQFVPIAQIPARLQDALLAVEDSRFREHGGIDWRGVARALVANLSGGLRQGASTITQQVARTFFLSSRRTAERKIKEALLALKIEEQLSKDQILELYMNQIYLGHRAYGFAAAAQVYFGKPLASLSVAECAMLAGLPQNPAFANPITNLARATQRQQVVLARMRDTGVITAAEHDAARAEVLSIRSPLQVDVHAEHVAEMARLAVYERFGEQSYTQGLKVHTSLIAADQRAAWAALRRGLLEHDRKQAWRGPEDQEDLPDNEAEAEQLAGQALKEHRDDDELRVGIVMQASPKALQVRLATGEKLSLSGEALRWVQPALAPTAPKTIALRRGAIIRVLKSDKGLWSVSQWPEAQGAFVALDAASGRVRAMVGGFDFNRQPFNHATQAWRQPGSSFKPFLYSAALEQGVMPATLINDAPWDGDGAWNPQNSDGQFDGPISLRRALAKSKNLVSIRLLQQIGPVPARQWAARFGFDADKQPANLTLALGAGSVTPLQMATAYAVLANGGHRVTPRLIERITDAQGKLLYEAPPAAPLSEWPAEATPDDAAGSAAPPTAGSGLLTAATGSASGAAPAVAAAPTTPASGGGIAVPSPAQAASAADGQRVIPARNVFITSSLLQEVTRSGTAARAQAQLRRPDLFGKTGTTNDAVDAWFAGFQPSIAAVAWIGYDTPRSLGQRESGGGLALPVWISYMAQALKEVPVQALVVPPGVQEVAGDWRYSELAEGGMVARIGIDDIAWAALQAPAASGAAASAPLPGPAGGPAGSAAAP